MKRDDFPYFRDNKTVYLDNAATTQKPDCVIDSILNYYTKFCSNTHRGSYEAGNIATAKYEASREYIKEFIGAESSKEIIFTKGVTEGINMVAQSYVKDRFKTVIISSLEHHSNIVPWHMLEYRPGAGLEVVKCDNNLCFDLNHYESILKRNSNSFVSISHVSNAFGVIHPVKEIVRLAHKYNCRVLVDGAQSIPRFQIDMKELQADFYVFSGHKCYGPTGVGVLYINKNVLTDFRPYQTGGATIESVTYEKSTLLEPPLCFEAGTQNIAGVLGLKTALEYINSIGYQVIYNAEETLKEKIYRGLKEIGGVKLYNNMESNAGNISFNVEGIAPIDIGILLDKQGVAVRSGHHCAMPIMNLLGIDGTVRVSLALYNNEEDVETFFKALHKALSILRG